MSETLITWPDVCVFCGDSNGKVGRTANEHWKQFRCGTEYEVVGEKTAWIQDDDCKIAALMEELAAEKQQRQAAEEETKRWMELAEHQAIGRDKLGTDLAAATKRAEEYREKIEQLETDKANYHDKWWNALEKLRAAEQENARLREVLAWVEWFEHHESRVDLKCPFCFAYQYEGHESDCRLVAALLAKPEEKQ